MTGTEIAVLAVASTTVEREERRSLEEMIFDTATSALGSANLTHEDLDGVVVSGNDEIDGRVISIMASAGPAGGVDRDTTMIASSADQALSYGFLRLLAGQGERVLVVGWAKPSESVDPDRAELMAAEPYVLRDIGMNHTIAAALQASTWVREGAVAGATVAYPLDHGDLPGRGDSVHAIVIAADGAFPEGSELAWIVDSGWATSSYELGGRDLSELESLRGAVDQIVARNPAAAPANWARTEIAAGSEYVVRETVRVLGLRPDSVNVAGGLAELPTSPHVAGLGRFAEAIRATTAARGGAPTKTAGIGYHGFASQGATVMVFSTHKRGVE
ncbi:hypothetical protein [Compostimonas suwonensis]|uniref:3-oxoacyl-[acyl-carrier-protein] synthase-3 n=1 Tax=Compostimonas suwonensis TaxID=1048394 RepID=A0A2M9BU72_9MICO|nr:hypothetical protein [Compostimonas suwonensis]PJJ61508.1 hypothetical protein CLV54_2453 [Compostimonas suwonensis]